MLVARQYDVDTAARECIHGQTRAANDAFVAFQTQPFKRMMSHHYSGNVIGHMCEFFRRRLELAKIDPAILDCQGPCRVDPDDRDFAIGVERVRVRRDVTLVS